MGNTYNIHICANLCRGKSELFAFGAAATCGRSSGCKCSCEMSTGYHGDCLQTKDDTDFNIYKFTTALPRGRLNI